MWQSRVENEHYSVSLKIEQVRGHQAIVCIVVQSLVRLHTCVMSYRP